MLAFASRVPHRHGVFIKRNRSRQGGKTYTSVLLVEGVREALPRPRGRPCRDAPVKTRVVHRTLANLSRLPSELVDLIEQYCRGQVSAGASTKLRMVSTDAQN